MQTFNTMAFMDRAVRDLLAQDPGGLKNIDQIYMRMNRSFEQARRRAVEQDRQAFGRNVQNVAQLFSAGTRELQMQDQRTAAMQDIETQNSELVARRRAQAEQTALGQLPAAYETWKVQWDEAHKPSFLEKVAGAVVGGAASAFLPPLAGKLFPNLFTQVPPAPQAPAPVAPQGTAPTAYGPTYRTPTYPWQTRKDEGYEY